MNEQRSYNGVFPKVIYLLCTLQQQRQQQKSEFIMNIYLLTGKVKKKIEEN